MARTKQTARKSSAGQAYPARFPHNVANDDSTSTDTAQDMMIDEASGKIVLKVGKKRACPFSDEVTVNSIDDMLSQLVFVEGDKDLHLFPAHLRDQIKQHCITNNTLNPSCLMEAWPYHTTLTYLGQDFAPFVEAGTTVRLLSAKFMFNEDHHILVVQQKHGTNLMQGRAAIIVDVGKSYVKFPGTQPSLERTSRRHIFRVWDPAWPDPITPAWTDFCRSEGIPSVERMVPIEGSTVQDNAMNKDPVGKVPEDQDNTKAGFEKCCAVWGEKQTLVEFPSINTMPHFPWRSLAVLAEFCGDNGISWSDAKKAILRAKHARLGHNTVADETCELDILPQDIRNANNILKDGTISAEVSKTASKPKVGIANKADIVGGTNMADVTLQPPKPRRKQAKISKQEGRGSTTNGQTNANKNSHPSIPANSVANYAAEAQVSIPSVPKSQVASRDSNVLPMIVEEDNKSLVLRSNPQVVDASDQQIPTPLSTLLNDQLKSNVMFVFMKDANDSKPRRKSMMECNTPRKLFVQAFAHKAATTDTMVLQAQVNGVDDIFNIVKNDCADYEEMIQAVRGRLRAGITSVEVVVQAVEGI